MEENKVLRVISTTEDRLQELPIAFGQMIFVKDSRRILLDTEIRNEYNQIIVLQTETQRENIIPVSAFYFVNETKVLWRYDDGWFSLTTPPSESVDFIEGDLPVIGTKNVLYVTKSSIYQWDGEKYIDMNYPAWQVL